MPISRTVSIEATTLSTTPDFIGVGLARSGEETTIRAYWGRLTDGTATFRVRNAANPGVDLLVATTTGLPVLGPIGVLPSAIGDRTLEYYISISSPSGIAIVSYVLEEEEEDVVVPPGPGPAVDRNPAYSPLVSDASGIGEALAPSAVTLSPKIIQTRRRR
jgi:hypothetical protein